MIALKFRPLHGRSCGVASWTNLREANFEGCLVLQTWLRCLASSNVKAIVTAVSLTAFDTIDRPNMWNLEMQSGRTWKSHLQEERQPIAILLSPQSSFEHSRCFHKDTKGADGAADLLEVLRNSPLEKLNFGECYEIPSAAWQKLRGASWTNLGEASFGWCLVLQTWLRCLASSLRHRVFFPMLRAIVTAVSLTAFGNIDRPKMWNRQLQTVGLTKVTCKSSGNKLPSIYPHRIPPSPFEHSRCFYNDTKGADGAADLLEGLRHSPLEKLNFMGCSQIPSSAWQKLRSASWPNLREANFYRCLVLQI